MRVRHFLYLHQYFVPPDGAGGTRSLEMSRRLLAAGHQVTLVTSSAFFPENYRLSRMISTLHIDGILVLVIRVPYSNRMGFLSRVLAFLKFAVVATLVACRAPRPDVIFATSTPLTIAIPGIVAKWWHRRPLVFEVRDLWPELPIALGLLRNPLLKWAARWLERQAYTSSDQIVALSPGMKEGICASGVPADKVTTIPNACDTAAFSNESVAPFPLPDGFEGRSVVTYAGTLGAINGVEYLVRVAAAMGQVAPEARFLIVGDGAMRERLQAEARALGVLETNLWFLPPVPKRAMPSLLRRTTIATSLFLDIPEMQNNSANKFFDALAAGTPVAINYGGWHAQLLEAEGAGIVLHPHDHQLAAKQLADLLSDEKALSQARTAARMLARTRFDRDVLAGELRRLLEATAER